MLEHGDEFLCPLQRTAARDFDAHGRFAVRLYVGNVLEAVASLVAFVRVEREIQPQLFAARGKFCDLFIARAEVFAAVAHPRFNAAERQQRVFYFCIQILQQFALNEFGLERPAVADDVFVAFGNRFVRFFGEIRRGDFVLRDLAESGFVLYFCAFVRGGRKIFLFLFFDDLVDEFVHRALHFGAQLRLGTWVLFRLDALPAPREGAAQIAPRPLAREPLFDIENMLLFFEFLL